MILIGSRALIEGFSKLLDYDFVPTIDMDHDYIAYDDEWTEFMHKSGGAEIADTPKGVRAFLVSDGKYRCEYYEAYIAEPNDSNDMILKHYKDLEIAPLGLLLAIKLSHRYKKNTKTFIKTMKDIHRMRDEYDIKMTDFDKEVLVKREEESLNYNHPKLNVSKNDFFVDDIYKYDHDSIHRSIAILEQPAYTYYMKDNSEVMTSKEKFDALAHEVKIYGVYEEACVLALERSQIPSEFETNRHKSFSMALEKVCTSITSGWFREFAWEHYLDVIELYDHMNSTGNNYVKIHKRNRNMLLPHKG